jgi:hypothetical protein
MMRSLTVQVLLWACTTTVLLAVPTRGEDQKITYDEHVKPIFREHCFTCHNSANAKSDLALDTYAGVMKGGSSGEVVLASDPDSSRLWMLVSHQEEPKMPPMQDKLADAKLELIKSWIIGGALENAGSTAKKPSKPRIDLASSGGAARPEGPAILPESLPRQPFFYSPKTRALTALAASPWAPLVAVAGHKQIVLYHSDSGELLGILPFPEGVPHVLRFSRSGSLLLAGGGRGGQSGKVVVFDVKTGQRVFEVGDELDVVLAADISEDHRRIALGGPLRVVRIYNTSDGSLVGEIRKHNEWITAIEFSPDGVLLATGDRNGDLYAWEAETIREYQTLKGHTAAVTAVSWRPDSNILASSSEDGSVRLWEMENGQQVKTWTAHGGGQQVVFAPFADMALRAVFTHDAARVVAGDWTGQVRAWNVGDGQAAFDLAMNPPTLEMLAQQAEQEAGQAAAEAESAAAEVAAAEQSLAVADAAFHQAAEALAKAQAAFEKAQADQGAAQSRKAAAEQTASAKRSAAEAARAKAAAAKQAADAAADVQTAQSTQ